MALFEIILSTINKWLGSVKMQVNCVCCVYKKIMSWFENSMDRTMDHHVNSLAILGNIPFDSPSSTLRAQFVHFFRHQMSDPQCSFMPLEPISAWLLASFYIVTQLALKGSLKTKNMRHHRALIAL